MNLKNKWLILVILIMSYLRPVLSEIVTVNTASDDIDIDSFTATISDLPGPDGRIGFSEAVIATKNTPGVDTIGFAIPQNEWINQYIFPGCAVIQSSYTYYWNSSDTLIIDGRTQTAFTGDTNPDGAEVVLSGNTFYFNADGSALFGIHAGEVQFSGSNNLIKHNTGNINITLFNGSGSLVQGNTCGTIKIDRSNDNIIIGNTMNRVRVLGFGSDQPADNNRIGGSDLSDRNYIIGYGTFNSEGMPAGTAVQLYDAANTVIENNYIGTTPDGLEQGNWYCTIGVGFEASNQNTLIKDNLIAGILGHGQGPHWPGYLFGWAILVGGSGSGVTISGNTVGLDANGEPTLRSVTGIDIGTDRASQVTDITIENNEIAGHYFNGISIGHNVPQVRISGNSIYNNGWLGIDLIPSGYGTGVTQNDDDDIDTGGNDLQNYPMISNALSDGINVTIFGSLSSYPSSDFTIEFFASPALDESGYGEGKQYLGATTATTDANGDVDFDHTILASVDPTWFLTATATLEPSGKTSEFSSGINFTEIVSSMEDNAGLPETFQIISAYPNPFNPSTTIQYQLPAAGSISIEIFNVQGKQIKTLLNQQQASGIHHVKWDGKDSSERSVPSGIYFARFGFENSYQTKRLFLVK